MYTMQRPLPLSMQSSHRNPTLQHSSIVKKFFEIRDCFCTSTSTLNSPWPFHLYTLEKKQCLLIMYTMYTNASNNTPFYIHVSLYMV